MTLNNIQVENLKYNGRASANQFKIELGNMVHFQSYESPIITIDHENSEVTVYPDYCYSSTTTRWRNRFLLGEGFNEISTTASLDEAIKAGKCIVNEQEYTVKKENR